MENGIARKRGKVSERVETGLGPRVLKVDREGRRLDGVARVRGVIKGIKEKVLRVAREVARGRSEWRITRSRGDKWHSYVVVVVVAGWIKSCRS